MPRRPRHLGSSRFGPHQTGFAMGPNAAIPRFPEPAAQIAELRMPGDAASFDDALSDEELVDAVRRAGGVVHIGLKPPATTRTAVTRVVPAMTRAEVLSARSVLAQHGVSLRRTFRNIAAVVAEIEPELAPILRKLPQVNYVEPETFYSLASQDTSWGVKKVGAHTVWSQTGNSGQYAYITMLDNGIDLDHWNYGDGPAGFLSDCKVVEGVSTSCFHNTPPHGSIVASVIAGRDNDQGYIGIAKWPANFASINVNTDFVAKSVPAQAVAAGLDWAISTGYPRHIVNMSFGACEDNSLVASHIQQASNAGILLIASAGNLNSLCASGTPPGATGVTYPGRYSQVIAVSGTTDFDEFWKPGGSQCSSDGSRYGPEVELSAPYWTYGMGASGTYTLACGTSFAAPVVTAVAAMIWTANQGWSAAQVRQRLQQTAIDLGPAGRDNEFGYGRVSAVVAAGVSMSISGPADIGQAGQYQWQGTVMNDLNGYSVTWERSQDGGAWHSVGSESTLTLTIDSESEYILGLRATATGTFGTVFSELFVFVNTVCGQFIC